MYIKSLCLVAGVIVPAVLAAPLFPVPAAVEARGPHGDNLDWLSAKRSAEPGIAYVGSKREAVPEPGIAYVGSKREAEPGIAYVGSKRSAEAEPGIAYVGSKRNAEAEPGIAYVGSK